VTRYLLLTASRTRAPVVGLVALAFAVLGIFADTRMEVGSTWGLTALLGGALCAWIAGAVLAAETDAQADMAAVALGGRTARLRLDARLVVAVAVLVAVCFVACPLLLTAAGRAVFARTPGVGDVLAAALAHLACGAVGGLLGVAFAPPRVRRRAVAVLATLAAILVLIALSIPLGPLGGPVAVAAALTDAPANRVTGDDLVALAGCVVLVAVGGAAVRTWTRRAG
jgi:hypothetical protein